MAPIELPRYLKITSILFGIMLFFAALIFARSILIPILIALLLSLLLVPLCKKLESYKIPGSIAAICCILILLGAISTVVYFLSAQVKNVAIDLKEIGHKINSATDQMEQTLEVKYGIEQANNTNYFQEFITNFTHNSANFLTATLNTTADFLTSFVLITLSVFFMLYYRNFFKEFLFKVFQTWQHEDLREVLSNIQKVVQNYIVGLFTVIAIICAMNTIGLYLLNVEYALFFGVLAGLLNIIPFIGVLIGSLLPVAFALVTKDSAWYAVGVAAVFWIIQFLEGNFITPNIVGSKVSLNPYAAILALFIGGAVWGPAGMVLFIPYLAMFKVMFDAIDELKPYGFLLGDPYVEKEGKIGRKIKKKLRRRPAPKLSHSVKETVKVH